MCKFLAAAALILAVPALADVVEFYGGDGDSRCGLSSEMNGLITGGAWVFDDFDHQGGPITALWGNFLINYTAVESAHFEIRSGISNGNGGTLHAFGQLSNPTYIPTGRVYHGFTERFIKGSVSIPSLPAGRYYLAIQPRQTGPGRSFLDTTSATDLGPTSDPNPKVTGTPLKNGNSWFNSAHFGVFFRPASGQCGAGTWDYSYGVEVPEPLGFAMLLAALGFRRRH